MNTIYLTLSVSNGLSSLGDLPPLTGVSNQNKSKFSSRFSKFSRKYLISKIFKIYIYTIKSR